MATRTNSHNDESGILNVLLHGAFTFVHNKKTKQLHALIPRLKEHAYRAGSWLAETELQRGSYELKGVEASDTLKFERDKNILVKFRRLSDKKRPYATLKFPYPKQIRSLRVAEVPIKSFDNPKYLIGPKKTMHMATLQVLTYDIDDENKLALKEEKNPDEKGHFWEPAFTGNYINLHIFSSEDYYHKLSNAEEDFNQCVALLGVKLKLITLYLPASEILLVDDLPDGVTPEETEALAVRTRRMAQLGRLVVQGGDANLAWHGNDALDGDPGACGSLGGC